MPALTLTLTTITLSTTHQLSVHPGQVGRKHGRGAADHTCHTPSMPRQHAACMLHASPQAKHTPGCTHTLPTGQDGREHGRGAAGQPAAVHSSRPCAGLQGHPPSQQRGVWSVMPQRQHEAVVSQLASAILQHILYPLHHRTPYTIRPQPSQRRGPAPCVLCHTCTPFTRTPYVRCRSRCRPSCRSTSRALSRALGGWCSRRTSWR